MGNNIIIETIKPEECVELALAKLSVRNGSITAKTLGSIWVVALLLRYK